MCSQWYYYVRQRDNAEEWKCQPHKWLSPDLERHEILLGSLSLFVTSSLSSLITCYLSNGGWSKLYYEFDEYTWIWWFLQWPVIFIFQVRNYIRGIKSWFLGRFLRVKTSNFLVIAY
jgi:lathosterol oxidase